MRLNSKLYKALGTNDAQTIKAAYLTYVEILGAKRAKKDKENEVFDEQIKKKWLAKPAQHVGYVKSH